MSNIAKFLILEGCFFPDVSPSSASFLHPSCLLRGTSSDLSGEKNHIIMEI